MAGKEKLSDQTLVDQVQQGNSDALDQLIQRHRGKVLHYLESRTNQPELAEDLCQEAAIKAWKNIKRLKNGQAFEAWLTTIARRCLSDHLRRPDRNTCISLSCLEELLQGQERTGGFYVPFITHQEFTQYIKAVTDSRLEPERIVLDQERRALDQKRYNALNLAVESLLSDQQRQVVELKYFEELRNADVASIMDRSESAIKSFHHRALNKLRKGLAGL